MHIARALQGLDDEIEKLHYLIQTHTCDDFNTKLLNADEWSVPELLDHLIQVHEFAVSRFSKLEPLPKRTFMHMIKRSLVSFILRNGIKVPVQGAPPRNPISSNFEALLLQWNTIHERLKQETFKQPHHAMLLMMHPISGPLSIEESICFIRDHIRYHRIRLLKYTA